MYSLDSPEVRQFLTEWFSGGKYQFGQFRNKHASNINEYINFIKNSYLAGEPAFQSVQPMATIEKLFWEFDCEDKIENVNYSSEGLDYVWIQTLKLCNKIEELNAKPLITYSGRRGFHVWVYTYTIHANKESERKAKLLYKEMVFGILGNIEEYPNIDTVPTHVNALARIPFSYHQKSQNQVIPLTKNRQPFMPNLQEYKDRLISKEIMEQYLWKVKNKLEKSAFKTREIKDWEIRPCVRNAFVKSLSHYANLAFVFEAIYAGWSDKEIHEIFKDVRSDYDEFKTQYQIDYQREQIRDEGILPPSKETLLRWGICNECGKCGGSNNPWKEGN